MTSSHVQYARICATCSPSQLHTQPQTTMQCSLILYRTYEHPGYLDTLWSCTDDKLWSRRRLPVMVPFSISFQSPTFGQSLQEAHGNMPGPPQFFDGVISRNVQERDRHQAWQTRTTVNAILSPPVFSEDGIVKEVADEVAWIGAFADSHSAELW